MRAARTQVNSQRPGGSWREAHQPSFPGVPGAFERDQAEDGTPEQIGGQGVHDHAEQFLAADALAAQDTDDGVVAGGLEVAGLAVAGDLQQVVDEAGGEGFGPSLDFGVAVEPGRVGAGVAVFALQVVEQLDEVALLGMGAALAACLVVLAEVPVEHCGVDGREVAIEAVGGHPRVQRLSRKDIGADGRFLVRAAVPVVDGAQVLVELLQGDRPRIRYRRMRRSPVRAGCRTDGGRRRMRLLRAGCAAGHVGDGPGRQWGWAWTGSLRRGELGRFLSVKLSVLAPRCLPGHAARGSPPGAAQRGRTGTLAAIPSPTTVARRRGA